MSKYTFYRPHPRVTQDNQIIDPNTGEVQTPPSMTKQSFAAECDINNILRQYKKTGMISHINAQASKGMYLDLPAEVDFQTALNTVIRAEEAFDTLPARLRARFNNDPAEFLIFSTDPRNQKELIELGLAQAIPKPDQAVPPVSAPPAPVPAPAPDAPPK